MIWYWLVASFPIVSAAIRAALRPCLVRGYLGHRFRHLPRCLRRSIRALLTARPLRLEGKDLFGGEQCTTARICEVGPYLALKLRAFRHRQQGKDAFDILYTLKHYDGGTDAALEAFAAEVKAGNPACPDAMETLKVDFAKETDPGPTRAAHFVFGQPDRREPEDTRLRRTLIQQEMVNFAAALLRTASRS